MSQQVQELIDKIKLEGVQAAEDQAKDIEAQAQSQADKIIADAKQQAKQFIVEAQAEAQKLQESAKMAIKQASRDTILSLRKQIECILQKVITAEVSDSLTKENLSSMIQSVVERVAEGKEEVSLEVVLSVGDLKMLEEGVIAKLKNQLKNPIKFQSSAEIGKGFTISFDEGKSCFDFTDESLAQHLGNYLNSQVADLVKESV